MQFKGNSLVVKNSDAFKNQAGNINDQSRPSMTNHSISSGTGEGLFLSTGTSNYSAPAVLGDM